MKKRTPVSRKVPPTVAEGNWLAGDLKADCLELLASALKKQWKRYRRGLKRCQEKFSEKAVHNSRVEARRLLALVELLAPFLQAARVKKITLAIKAHLDTFDDLRDIQVQMQTVSSLRRMFAAARLYYEYLCKLQSRTTRRTRKQIKRVKSGRLAKLIATSRLELGRRRNHTSLAKAIASVSRTLSQAFRTTCRLRNQIDSTDTSSIHQTRVAFKKFRYMVEALANYLTTYSQPRLKAMHDYQTLMGDIQDAEVLVHGFDKFLSNDKSRPKSAGQFQQELIRRREGLIRIYMAAADQLKDFGPQTKRS